MPLVSCVMPAYNVEPFVVPALGSITQQTLTDIEIIAVDDGSTDQTLKILQTIKDPRLTIISQPNKGLAAALNVGIRASNSPFISILDADDIWYPTRLRHHLDRMSVAPLTGLTYNASHLLDREGRLITTQVDLVDGSHLTPRQTLLRYPIQTSSTICVRQSALEAVAFRQTDGQTGWYDEALTAAIDHELACRLATTTLWKLEAIPLPLTGYRIHSDGISGQSSARSSAVTAQFLERLRRYAPGLVEAHGPSLHARRLLRMARLNPVYGRKQLSSIALMIEAIRVCPQIMLEEPRLMTMILLEGGLSDLLPRPLYLALWRTALQARSRLSRTGPAPFTPM